MIDFFKKVMEQALDLELTVRFTKQDGEWFAALGNELDGLSLEELKKYNEEDVYVIGGESVYRQLLPYCRTAHITKIDHSYEADAFFPDLDSDPEWEITADSDEMTYFDIAYTFLKYERKAY